jgi:hypothetical protein
VSRLPVCSGSDAVKAFAKVDTHSIIKLEAISFCDIRPDAGSQFQIIASWLKERYAP